MITRKEIRNDLFTLAGFALLALIVIGVRGYVKTNLNNYNECLTNYPQYVQQSIANGDIVLRQCEWPLAIPENKILTYMNYLYILTASVGLIIICTEIISVSQSAKNRLQAI